MLYVVAGFAAFISFFLSIASVRRGDPVTGPHPGALFIYLLIFYVAVEAAKAFWAPLKPLSDAEVAKKKKTASRIAIAFVIIFIILLFLE